jgi:uncharacterized protein YcfL
MKKVIFVFGLLMCVACSKESSTKSVEVNDSIEVVDSVEVADSIIETVDSIEIDSII